MNNVSKGKKGEEEAARHLESMGMTITERNYRTREGEIDIIAYEGDTLVFVEVKTRESQRFGLPREAVTQRKKRNLSKAALAYMEDRSLFDRPARFDVVEINITENGKEINHIKNAFEPIA
ncbi:MAG: YraN family protein [Bacillota bacterium]|nr:YraN family protein [Bacillota bacterium]